MKLLFVIGSLRSGGKERRLTELVNALSVKTKYNIELILLRKVEHYKIISSNIKKHYILEEYEKKNPFIIFYRLNKLLIKIKPDLIHSWGFEENMYILLFKIFSKCILVNSQITDAPSDTDKGFIINLMRRAMFINSNIILSNSNAGLYAYNVNSLSNSYVIYNGFSFSRITNINYESVKKNYNILPNETVIGMVGAFENRKDYKTFILCILEILQFKTNVRIFCIGEGYLRNEMMKLIPPLYRGKFVFTGNVNNVEEFIAIFDIALLLTNFKIHGEGISNSIMEYMALGKPVIATDSGGTSEIIENNYSGFVIQNNNIKLIVDKIMHLIDAPQLAKKMGDRGLEIIKSKFTIQIMIEKFYNIYRGIKS